MEGGHGLAAVLLGEVDASGRLPFSVPTEESHLPPFDAESESFAYDQWHGYWHLARAGTPPAYPFGFGLSYTTVAITGVAAEAVADGIQIRASLRNTGGRGGGEVVQVYVRRAGSRRPARLMAFKRIELAAGDDAAAELRVSRATLAERDTVSHSMVVRPGTYEVRVARHACDAGTSVAVAIS
jgi:beta-glucosidase